MTHTVHHLNTNKPSRENTPRAFSHRGTLYDDDDKRASHGVRARLNTRRARRGADARRPRTRRQTAPRRGRARWRDGNRATTTSDDDAKTASDDDDALRDGITRARVTVRDDEGATGRDDGEKTRGTSATGRGDGSATTSAKSSEAEEMDIVREMIDISVGEARGRGGGGGTRGDARAEKATTRSGTARAREMAKAAAETTGGG